MRSADLLGAFFCWLFNRLRGRKTSLREEFKDTLATRHLVVGYLVWLIFFILCVVIFSWSNEMRE